LLQAHLSRVMHPAAIDEHTAIRYAGTVEAQRQALVAFPELDHRAPRAEFEPRAELRLARDAPRGREIARLLVHHQARPLAVAFHHPALELRARERGDAESSAVGKSDARELREREGQPARP